MINSNINEPQKNITDAAFSVVMITLNEEAAIAKVVNNIRVLYPLAEIVVVDSGIDRTAEIAGELGCKVVKQYPPQGYGPAMHRAFISASKNWVITMDCDGTYPVEAIKELLAKASEGYDLVSASRLRQRPKNMPLENYLANWLFAFLARTICGVESTDVHTGMRLYRRSLLEQFPYQPEGMALPVELQVGPTAVGYKCVEIFIDYKPRIGESKLQKFSSTIWTMKRLWRWRRFLNGARRELARQRIAS